MKKIISAVLASALTATALTAAVSAYDFGGKDLGKNWSINVQVPASEFADLTADSEEEYWSIKPMDSAWTFIDPNGVGGPELAEGKDAYPLQKEDTSITFKVPADVVDSIKTGGMVFIGHSITLKTLTVSSEAPVTEAPATETAPAGDANTSTGDKTNADTGVEGVAAVAAIAVIAGAAVVICKKRS